MGSIKLIKFNIIINRKDEEVNKIIDIYGLFIEQIFGSFFSAVLGIAFIMFIILILGNVSPYSAIWFEYMFLMAMGIGYGNALISVTMSIIIISIFLFQLKAFLDRGSGAG